uniref:Sushi domain-containing protein n=1 Tax=Otus sunia TaxID=257818 RepID=A0A8C8BFA2_9STRI
MSPSVRRVSVNEAVGVLQCPSPPNIKNGHHESKDVKVFIPGMSVKYYCDWGYVLTGKTTVSCLTSGAWSIPYPRCEGELPKIQHGEVAEGLSTVYPSGANVTFRCHPGYVLWGSHEAKCQPDGRWVPAVPICEPGEWGRRLPQLPVHPRPAERPPHARLVLEQANLPAHRTGMGRGGTARAGMPMGLSVLPARAGAVFIWGALCMHPSCMLSHSYPFSSCFSFLFSAAMPLTSKY